MPDQSHKARLTDQQRACLDDYFAHPDQSGQEIYARHYRARGKAARTNMSRLIKMPAAQAYLEKRQKAVQARAEHSEDDIIRGFAEIAFFDPAAVFNEHWDLKAIEEIPPAARRAIASITPTQGGMFKVTFHNKNDALKNLGTLLGMYKDKTDSSEGGLLKQLIELLPRTGRPGTLRFDMAIAARSNFDADE